MNKSAADMLDVDAAKVIGQHLQTVVRIPDVLDVINRAVETGQSAGKQVEVAGDRGQLTIDLHAAKIAGTAQDGIAALLVLRDITEIARTTAVRAEFVANASHELRTPLATIRASVDSLVSTEAGDSESIQKVLPILDRHVARLEEMTNDLLDLNIIETAKRQLGTDKIELGRLVGWAKERLTEAAGEKNIELKIGTNRPDSAIVCDRTLIQLILHNLIDNAIKFTPTAGRIECDLRLEDEQLRIQVSDTGCGIPAEMNERVFERFFQIEPSRTGGPFPRRFGLPGACRPVCRY